MTLLRLTLVAACVINLSGCNWCCFAKRQSESNCPTDIRQTVPWCAGEDAIFRCPCGVSEDYYGHKPTCWRVWPSSGEEWRDAHCAVITAHYPVMEATPAESLPSQENPTPEEIFAAPEMKSEPTILLESYEQELRSSASKHPPKKPRDIEACIIEAAIRFEQEQPDTNVVLATHESWTIDPRFLRRRR